jgi:hypothetical protein
VTDKEILDELTKDLPRRPMTERDRAIFDEYKRRRAAGVPMLTHEEWTRRRSANDSNTGKGK